MFYFVKRHCIYITKSKTTYKLLRLSNISDPLFARILLEIVANDHNKKNLF